MIRYNWHRLDFSSKERWRTFFLNKLMLLSDKPLVFQFCNYNVVCSWKDFSAPPSFHIWKVLFIYVRSLFDFVSICRDCRTVWGRRVISRILITSQNVHPLLVGTQLIQFLLQDIRKMQHWKLNAEQRRCKFSIFLWYCETANSSKHWKKKVSHL